MHHFHHSPCFQLVYVSAAVVPFSQADLRELLMKSREKNATLGITGILLFADGTFFQVLEGERTAVESLFNVIERDRRHANKLVISERMIHQKNFGNWCMGFVQDESAIHNMPGFLDFFAAGGSSFLELEGDTKRINQIIEGFRRGRWRRQSAARHAVV